MNGRKKTRSLTWNPAHNGTFPMLINHRVRGGSNPIGGAYEKRVSLLVTDPTEPDRRTELLIQPELLPYLITQLQHVQERIENG